MTDQPTRLQGVRTLIVGASSGIGREFAIAAHANGARVALAARRIDILTPLAQQLGGTAYRLDVSDPHAVDAVVRAAAEELGGIDAVFFTSAVVPLARVEDTDASTWAEAFAVNATGPALVMSASLPYLSDDAVILIASSHEVGRPRAGIAAYSASKAALDEILHSWRNEHPEIPVVRIGVGPTDGTEILRGADRDLAVELYGLWRENGQVPDEMSTVVDVANTVVAVLASARENPSVVTEIVHLAPKQSK